jgi:tRNA dimethylallyltransferase
LRRWRKEDPAAAARLRPSDTTRVARALEVVRSTRHPLAYWQREKIGGIAAEVRLLPLVLLPPREWLYDKCNLRFERMFGAEGIREVETLLGRGLDPSLPVMRAIGVPEIAAYLQGSLSREAALAAGQAATRQYAKRQYTWFSRQPPSGWPRFTEPLDERTIDRALAFLS